MIPAPAQRRKRVTRLFFKKIVDKVYLSSDGNLKPSSRAMDKCTAKVSSKLARILK